MKSGADNKPLQGYFSDLKEKYEDSIEKIIDGPIETLREPVPNLNDVPQDSKCFTIDPALNIKAWDKPLWEEYYEEGQKKMVRFNQRLASEINDKKDKGIFNKT